MQFVVIVFSQSLVMAAVCFAVVFMWLLLKDSVFDSRVHSFSKTVNINELTSYFYVQIYRISWE